MFQKPAPASGLNRNRNGAWAEGPEQTWFPGVDGEAGQARAKMG
jgi:hypothetical protein